MKTVLGDKTKIDERTFEFALGNFQRSPQLNTQGVPQLNMLRCLFQRIEPGKEVRDQWPGKDREWLNRICL